MLSAWTLALAVGLSASLASGNGPSSLAETTACEPGTARRVAERIQTRYDGIRDLEARFAQTSRSATVGGVALMDSDRKTGHVVFAKPGKMRWTYEAPDPSVVVSDGRTLWIHDVGGQTVTRLSVTQGFLSGAALQFLLGDGRLLESFEVSAERCEVGRVALLLVPREEATYERLGLVADSETGALVETSVHDLFGNRTHIEFEDMRVNLGPDDASFSFEVPEGVELIDYDAGPTG